MSITREQAEHIVGTKINNLDLYVQACTHKSKDQLNYETIEFMGDSVLGFVVTKYLYDNYKDKQEGYLTKMRTKLVRGTTLADIARSFNMGQFIHMDEKGMRNKWFNNTKILEDVFEAFVGAIYLDLGMVHAKRFVLDCIQNRVDWNMILYDDNYKDQLMRHCQAEYKCLPEYIHLEQEKDFTVLVRVMGRKYAKGWGKTKKAAEQQAAMSTLQILTKM